MSDDLVESLSAGEIAPYQEGMPALAPLSGPPDTWGQNVDLLHEHQRQPQIVMFGTPMPSGTTDAQVQAVLQQLGLKFEADFQALGYPAVLRNFAIKFFKEYATKSPRQVRCNHNFELPSELMGDGMANDFCNRLEGVAGTPLQKAQFLKASLIWLAKIIKSVNSQCQPESRAQGSATNHNVEAFYASLSNAEYKHLVEINNNAWCRTLQVLQRRWGDYTFQVNMQVATDYINSLPAHDQASFNVMTKGGIELANTVEFWTAMFDAATGAHNLPKDGAGIAREIAECERCMKTNRKQWLADSALQARYRTLLQLRQGG